TCTIPKELLATEGFSGEEVRDGVIHAYEFAASDPYRAVTHNKGIMNGIDPVIIATGNDWRAVEAGAHAYASKDGQYGSMTTSYKNVDVDLDVELEVSMLLGIVVCAGCVHQMSKLVYDIVVLESATE